MNCLIYGLLGWALVCEIFAKIPRTTLIEAFTLAHMVDQMGLCELFCSKLLTVFRVIYESCVVIPVFLREIETVASHCENHSVLSLPIEPLAARLENLTALLQFATLAARADEEICKVTDIS